MTPLRPQIEYVPIQLLELDSENPRLPVDGEIGEHPSQPELLRYMERAFSLGEIAESIVDRGFTGEEPLWVIPKVEDQSDGPFITVEGNRRLATAKLLTSLEHRGQLDESRRLTWSTLAGEAEGYDLSELPVFKHEKRALLLDQLAFRHISGVRRWSAEAKARYIHKMIKTEGISFPETARRIGSTTPAVRRQAESYAVLSQAQEWEYDISAARKLFGLFYNALQVPGIRAYAGLGDATSAERLVEKPVDENHSTQLKELLGLLYGSESRRKVIRESRDLADLGVVLSDEDATLFLLEKGNLSAAFRMAGGDRRRVLLDLEDARQSLFSANGQAFQWRDDEEVKEKATSVGKVVDELLKSLDLR